MLCTFLIPPVFVNFDFKDTNSSTRLILRMIFMFISMLLPGFQDSMSGMGISRKSPMKTMESQKSIEIMN